MKSEDEPGLEALRIDRQEETERPGFGRRRVATVILLLALGGATFGFLHLRAPVVTTADALTATATGGVRTVLNASGYVVARREATVSAKITGKVADVLFEEGMHVQADQVLARLDDANIRAQIELAEAERETAFAALAETRVQLLEAGKQLERIVALRTEGIASLSELDEMTARADSLKARLALQQMEIVVAERRLSVLNQQSQDTIIRAPFAGVAVSKDAQPGEMISPISAGGGFTRTGIGTIVDMDSLEIEVDVNESYLNRVKSGQPVEATLDAYPDWTIPARVIAIIPTADRQKATVRVRVAFARLDPRMLPQMGVRVAFQETDPVAADANSAVLIPRAALGLSPQTNQVWVLSNRQVQLRPIVLAEGDADPVTVLNGLLPGQKVVIGTSGTLKTGMTVRAQQP